MRTGSAPFEGRNREHATPQSNADQTMTEDRCTKPKSEAAVPAAGYKG